MKILIVNGYPQTSKGKEDFQKFQQTIQEIFRTQNDFVDTNFEFIIRTRDDLDDFIYELDSPYVKKSSARAVDYVDMVFMEGEPSLVPWSPQAAKMLILLRMCIRTKKILFASSFGMLALVFLSATNAEKSINIVNGKGKGGRITDILRFNEKGASIKHDEYYLDNTTGDLYSYNYDSSEWVPKMNCGLHYKKAAQSSDNIGKFIVNTQVYKAKVFDDNPMSYLSRSDEDFCYTKKMYQQHWAISELPSEFVIPAKNTWDIHKFNFVNARKTFVVLAESRRCPQIVVFESYCLATLFNITKKFNITINILKNFITSKLKEIKAMTKNEMIGIEKISEIYRNKADDFHSFGQEQEVPASGRKSKAPRTIASLRNIDPEKQQQQVDNLLGESSIMNRPKTAKLVHSGYALAHHDAAANLIVENNTVRSAFKIKLSSDRTFQSREPGSKIVNLKNKGFMPQLDTNYDNVLMMSPTSNAMSFPMSAPNQVIALHNYLQKAYDSKKETQNRKNSFGQYTDTSFPGSREFDRNTPLANVPEAGLLQKNKAEIARMLYPELPRNALKEEDLWVPGQLSQARPQTAMSKTKVKVNMESSFSNRFYSSYTKFKNVNPDEARAKPSIRTSGDYLTEDERKRLEEKENSKKNLGPAYLSLGSKSSRGKMIPNYVTLTYSEPPCNHKFREVKKINGLVVQ